MSLLQALLRSGALRTLDHALATTLRRRDSATPDEVLAAAALASLALAQGHAAFDPAAPDLFVHGELPWPSPQEWSGLLSESRWVAAPETPEAASPEAPLVFEHGLLYLRRYREYERRLAMRLRSVASRRIDLAVEPIAPLFHALFPDAKTGDLQARAAALALRRALLLVTGGPGTGKTTTIARMLLLRIAQATQSGSAPPRIALAAPTGRAADRMAGSLQRAITQMQEEGVDATLLAQLPRQASTLHRLLGTIPDSSRFRHDADNPLPFDIVVVDEASMVDLPLMCKLAEAVADGAQLVLLGDPDQLPSVEAGDVLSAVLRAAGDGDALHADDATALRSLLGEVPALSLASAPTAGLQGHRVHLRHGWRQDASMQLAPLADAVRAGDAVQTLSLLRSGELSGVHFHENVEDPLQAWPRLFDHWRALAAMTDPEQVLQQLDRLRLLTAVREGPQGARTLNARIEARLSNARIGSTPGWFPGRLLLVTENSYRHELFNGDVGVCMLDDQGMPAVWFMAKDGPRAFHPAALPAHESAFAMTVHKAQGSEFDTVWLQLPRVDSRVLGRELLYTAITRARRELHVAGHAEIISVAVQRQVLRSSGLTFRLVQAQ